MACTRAAWLSGLFVMCGDCSASLSVCVSRPGPGQVRSVSDPVRRLVCASGRLCSVPPTRPRRRRHTTRRLYPAPADRPARSSGRQLPRPHTAPVPAPALVPAPVSAPEFGSAPVLGRKAHRSSRSRRSARSSGGPAVAGSSAL